MRKVHDQNPKNQPYLPYREYFSSDVQSVIPERAYSVDIKIWPTNVIIEKGGHLILEVASGDTQGSGVF